MKVLYLNPIKTGLFRYRVRQGGGLFLPAGHNSKLAYAKNFKFGMEVASHNRSKKIMLNKQWLSWLPSDVITKCEDLKIIGKNMCNFEELYLLNEIRFLKSDLIL